MQADPLQQLKDIHTPPPPGWWPPAPGWWLLGLALIAILAWAGYAYYRYRQRHAAPRYALKAYQRLQQQYAAGDISTSDYLNATNSLIKRLLIHYRRIPAATQASGLAWLALLDDISGTQEFTAGPGQTLGNIRFSANPEFDVTGFNRLVEQLLRKANT